MKFISILALSGLAAAQVDKLIQVVKDVQDSTQSLDTTVKSFSGAGDVQSLQAASDKVLKTVSAGVTAVNSASTISLTDAVTIQGAVTNLQTQVETVVKDLKAKKETIVSAGAGGKVEESLTQQLDGAKKLQDAIGTKVPPQVQSLAQQLSKGINDALEDGIAAFKGTGSAGPAAGSAPSSGSSSSSSGSSSSGASSGSSSGSSGSSSSGSASTPKGQNASPAGAAPPSKASSPAATSAKAKPATYTGAASRNVAGAAAGAAALFAIAL